MKASEADKFKDRPRLADDAVAAPGHGGHRGGGAGGHDHGSGSMESVRTAEHCGRQIVIKTCYEITIDGKPLTTHLSVDDDGSLSTHALPEYAFSSAVDVVKKIIDAFPEDFPCDDQGHHGGGHSSPGHEDHDHGGKGSSSGQQGHGHGGHTHEHP